MSQQEAFPLRALGNQQQGAYGETTAPNAPAAIRHMYKLKRFISIMQLLVCALLVILFFVYLTAAIFSFPFDLDFVDALSHKLPILLCLSIQFIVSATIVYAVYKESFVFLVISSVMVATLAIARFLISSSFIHEEAEYPGPRIFSYGVDLILLVLLVIYTLLVRKRNTEMPCNEPIHYV